MMGTSMTEQQAQAFALVRDTNTSFFLTGRAGTGKTTFLKMIQREVDKRFLVVAPTGVAAIIAGGVTIHSFFGLPLEVITPKTPLRINERKREMLRAVDAIIVDEVSMVRCDVVDAMDRVLRKLMHSALPFGGKQMIFSGDMFQLEPITRMDAQRELLRDLYGTDTPYFYKAWVFKRFCLPKIEFQKVFRQNDPTYLRVLNDVRNYRVTADDLQVLNAHVCREVPAEGMAIILSSYRQMVDDLNARRLNELPGEERSYQATLEGNFKESAAPVDVCLKLKVDAQVMFTRNDANHRWVNGTLATVVSLSDSEIRVRVTDGTEYKVEQVRWENFNYHYDRETKMLEKEPAGSFTQYPLRLAWAITIHKSQGMTFDRMVLDLSRGVFTSGQLYVALSRLRSLDGLYLTAPVYMHHVRENAEIMAFANNFNDEELIATELADGAAIYRHLNVGDIDEAARTCMRLALDKVESGRLRDASLMLKRMLDLMVCDDCLMGMTRDFAPLKVESMVASFINAVCCLYGDHPELGIAYADRVLQRKGDCKEALWVKSRCLALLDRWLEADAVNVTLCDLEGDDMDKDPKALYHLSVVNSRIGDPGLKLVQFVLSLHPKYLPVLLELRRQVKTTKTELKQDQPNTIMEAFIQEMPNEDFAVLCRGQQDGDEYKQLVQFLCNQDFTA